MSANDPMYEVGRLRTAKRQRAIFAAQDAAREAERGRAERRALVRNLALGALVAAGVVAVSLGAPRLLDAALGTHYPVLSGTSR